MRFYPTSRASRITVTALWLAIALMSAGAGIYRHRVTWFGLIMLVNFALQAASTWSTYWDVEADALIQHGFLYRRSLQPHCVRYAGPVRKQRLQRWLRKSIELDVQGLPSVLYVNTERPADFLRLLELQAPEAEVVPF